MKEAEEIDNEKEKNLKKILDEVFDPKKQNQIFKKKIGEYNKPLIFSIIACFFCMLIGAVMPVFGAIMIKSIFAMLSITDENRETAGHKMNKWAFWLAIIAAALLVA